MSSPMMWVKLTIVSVVLLIFALSVQAQEHRHPPQDIGIHHQFYKSWYMPDNRAVSCCHDEDCFPAQSKFVDGFWFARKTDDEDWIKIPPQKIEQDRDSPDGRSHLCGRKYTMWNTGFSVFCFLPAAAG